MTPNLKIRSVQKEWMETEDLNFEEYSGVLEQIAKLSRLSFSYHLFENFIEKVIRKSQRSDLHLLEVGSGSGDLVNHLSRWGKRKGYDLFFTGVDLHPFSQKIARQKLKDSTNTQFVSEDIFNYRPKRPVDISYCSFVTHHFSPDDIVKFLMWLENHSRLGWLVHDIHRHYLPYYFMGAFTKLLHFHPMIVHDSQLSVSRSFLKEDWQRIVCQSGLDLNQVSISWRFPFKYCVERCKPILSM